MLKVLSNFWQTTSSWYFRSRDRTILILSILCEWRQILLWKGFDRKSLLTKIELHSSVLINYFRQLLQFVRLFIFSNWKPSSGRWICRRFLYFNENQERINFKLYFFPSFYVEYFLTFQLLTSLLRIMLIMDTNPLAISLPWILDFAIQGFKGNSILFSYIFGLFNVIY